MISNLQPNHDQIKTNFISSRKKQANKIEDKKVVTWVVKKEEKHGLTTFNSRSDRVLDEKLAWKRIVLTGNRRIEIAISELHTSVHSYSKMC